MAEEAYFLDYPLNAEFLLAEYAGRCKVSRDFAISSSLPIPTGGDIMRGMKLLAAALALTFAAGAIGEDAKAPAAPEVKRNILDRHDQSGVDGKEIVVGTAEFPKGGVIGFHTHFGDEAGYVLKGELVWRVQGQPDKTLKAGDYFFNPRGSVHSVIAAPGTDGGMAYSTWIVDKGKPLATPVK